MNSRRIIQKRLKPCVFILCLLPMALLTWYAINNNLGANPIERTNRFLGDWALRFLIISLTITPLRIITSWNKIIQFRRMLGLFAFTYIVLHLMSYIVLDQFFEWTDIWQDVLKRWYITIGLVAFVLLVPLAITSTKGWIKRIGSKNWKNLHKLIYPASILGVFHFYMMKKADFSEPLIYAFVLIILFGIRLYKVKHS